MQRIILSLLLLIISGLIGSCEQEIKKKNDLIDFIPEDTQIIIKINDLEQAKHQIRDNDILKNNTSINLYQHFEKIDVLSNKKWKNGLLCFSSVGKNNLENTFITKGGLEFLQADSLKTLKFKELSYNNETYYELKDNNDPYFATILDSTLIASSSKLIIENVLRMQNTQKSRRADLLKAFEVSDQDNPLTVLIDGSTDSQLKSTLLPNLEWNKKTKFSGWISADVSLNQNAIAIDGVAVEKDSLSSIIGIFDNTLPQENRIAQVTPITARGFISYTFDSYKTLKTNLAKVQDRSLENMPSDVDLLLEEVTEIGYIYLENERILHLTTLNPERILDLLDGTISETYRNIAIYSYPQQGIFEVLNPLITEFEANYYIQYESFILLAQTKNELKTIIANLQNKTLLAEQTFYKDASEKLSDESSILMLSTVENLKNQIAVSVQDSLKKNWSDLKVDDYEIATLQLIKEGNYAHLHGHIQKTEVKGGATSVNQIASTTLENRILSPPVLVQNHRTKGMDIVVQDINNNLYLISDKGKIFWKKQISGAIIGEVKQIDIYKNGRYQLLFATENTLYLLDRDGKEVKPYPIALDKPVTQPLSLFDYDKNKRYRTVITQENNLLMLDAKGDQVTGFKFSGTQTPIVAAPKHIRIGSKDYIIIQEESGKLTILDRLGSDRIKVKEPILFSANEWYQYQNKFTSTTAAGELIQIPSDGSIQKTNLNLNKDHRITATNKTLVSISDNILTIKDKKIELDYGIYTAPLLFYINNKIYISITDTQAKKVYLYDSNAELFPNFPVYGNSAMCLGNMDKDQNLEFVVQGDDHSILIYQIN